MKKIILVLMFSLGLVSAVNAESVCNSYSIEDKVGIGENMVGFVNDKTQQNIKKEKQIKQFWDKLAMRYHTAEIKKSDKETLCVYMATIGQGYLDIQLTPQEIERFERFLVEKTNGYKAYERNKDYFLRIVKFLKYYDKIDMLYSKKNVIVEISSYYGNDSFLNLAKFARHLEADENEATIEVRRFIYNKDMGKYFDSMFDYLSIETLKNRNDQDAKNIAKWAESKLKESK